MRKNSHYQKMQQDIFANIINPPLVTSQPVEAAQYNKESDMITAANATSTITTELPGKREKDYLLSRLDYIEHEHDKKLRKTFYMEDLKPKTPDEMVKLLKDGHYELNMKDIERRREMYENADDEEISWYDVRDFLIFRNPKHKKDRDGYIKATDKLKAARQKTKDMIIVKSPDDGLLALEAFESQTFH